MPAACSRNATAGHLEVITAVRGAAMGVRPFIRPLF